MTARISNLGRYINKYGILKTFENSKEIYPSIYLFKRIIRVHRLVHCLFNGPPVDLNYVIDHIDGNTRNNRASNLEWVTNSVNLKRAYLKKKANDKPITTTTKNNKQQIKIISEEFWKPHPVFNNIEISCAGRFRRTKNKVPSVGTLKKSGYLVMYVEGKSMYMHRLVAQTFLTQPPKHEFVDHIDGNRQNNSKSNLRWVTQSENNKNRKYFKGKENQNQKSPVVVSSLPGEKWKDLTREVVMGIPCSTHSRLKRSLPLEEKLCLVVGAPIPSRAPCEEGI